MTSTLSGTSDATFVPLPKKISSPTAAKAAALFDADVRELLAILEQSRKSAPRRAA